MTDWTDEDLWRTYVQLTEAEAAFRIHKSDLSLRPIRHQKKERVPAHILVCFSVSNKDLGLEFLAQAIQIFDLERIRERKTG